MKRMMSIAAIALFVAGSSVFACDSCGCKDKKAEGKKAACCAKEGEKCCKGEKACGAGEKKCDAGEKKAEAKK